jgi:hypothetical protein
MTRVYQRRWQRHVGVLDERVLLPYGGWLEPHESALIAKRKPDARVVEKRCKQRRNST